MTGGAAAPSPSPCANVQTYWLDDDNDDDDNDDDDDDDNDDDDGDEKH